MDFIMKLDELKQLSLHLYLKAGLLTLQDYQDIIETLTKYKKVINIVLCYEAIPVVFYLFGKSKKMKKANELLEVELTEFHNYLKKLEA